MVATKPTLQSISDDLSKLEDANSNLEVLLRAIGHISDLSAEAAYKTLKLDTFSEGHVSSAKAALDLITGLHSIAIDELSRSADARLAVDNAVYVMKQAAAS